MTPFEKILLFITQNWRWNVLVAAKIGMLMLLFLYFLFSLVVVRQIDLMSRTVSTTIDKYLRWAGRGLMGLAILVFILGLVIL